MIKKLGKPKTPKERPKVGKLVPQPNGRGAIWQGAPANPVAGPGRPASAIRESMRNTLDQSVLTDLLTKYEAGEIDRLGFANFLAKYGLGEKNEVTLVSPEVKDKLQQQVAIIGSKPVWDSQELLDQLSEVWK